MASNLSSIGFELPSAEYGQRLMGELAGYAARRVAAIPGDYAVWRSGSGAEIWFHVEGERGFFGHIQDGRVVAFRPFFACEGGVDVRVERLLQRPDDNAFEGLVVGEVAGGGQGLAFDGVDYALHLMRTLPITTRARLLGFAREVRVFASEAAFLEDGGGRAGEVRSFSGDRRIQFGVADNDNVPDGHRFGVIAGGAMIMPQTMALLRGVVVRYRRLENEVCERAYHWFLIDGPGGTFDVVADRDLVVGEPVPGMIVETRAAFSGRLAD